MNINQLVLEVLTPTSPDELLKYMSNIQYDNFTDENDYIIKSPQILMRQRKGICYDQVELERYFFNKLRYETRSYFFYEKLPITDNRTHTVLIFKENNKYYWFENSWYSYREIHGPFDTYDSAVKYIANQLKNSDKWKTVFVCQYRKLPLKNINIHQFGKYIIKHYRSRKLI